MKQIDLSTLDFENQTLSQARREVDERLQATQYFGSVTRQWMLLNLERSKQDKIFRWKINLDALSDALEKHLLLVPERERWRTFEVTLHTEACYHTIPITIPEFLQGDFMFIGADLSGYIPRDCHSAVRAAGFPRARFAYVRDAGHYVHIDQRQQFLDIILPELTINSV